MVIARNEITITTVSDGVSVVSVTEQYALSTSKTTEPSSGWSSSQPTWEPGKYLWIRNAVLFSNSSTPTYTPGRVSSEWEAINELILISPTEPTAPSEGQLWLNTEVAPHELFIYKDGTWVKIGTDLTNIIEIINELEESTGKSIGDLEDNISDLEDAIDDLDEQKANADVVATLRENYERLQLLIGEVEEEIGEDYVALINRVNSMYADLQDASVKFDFINNSLNVGEEGVFFGDTAKQVGIWIGAENISFINGIVSDGVDSEGNPKYKLNIMGTMSPSFLNFASGIFTDNLKVGEHTISTINGITVFNWDGE